MFMARALAAAATGSAAVAPALAADTGVDGAPLWRYVMGGDGPTGERFQRASLCPARAGCLHGALKGAIHLAIAHKRSCEMHILIPALTADAQMSTLLPSSATDVHMTWPLQP